MRFSLLFYLNSFAPTLLGLRKAHGVVAEVVDGIPLPQECVTKNGERTSWLRDIEAHERTDAAALDLEDVVVGGDAEVVASKSERQVWKRITLGTVDAVLAVEALLGTDLLVEQLSKSAWESDEGSAGVKDDASLVDLGSLVAEGDRIEVNLPVCLPAEWDLDHVAVVVVLVDTTKDALRFGPLLGVAEIEGEHGLIQKTLVNHVVEGGNHLVDRDGVIPKTHNTVETAECESKTGFRGGLCEVLVLDGKITNADCVLANVARKLARSILDLEIRAILLVGARIAVIVLGMQIAGDGAAVLARHPQVGAAGVENDLEVLRRSSDGDLGEVLRIQEIVDRHWVVLLWLNGVFAFVAEELFDVPLRAASHVFLGQPSHVIANVGVLELLGQRNLLQRHLKMVSMWCDGRQQVSYLD